MSRTLLGDNALFAALSRARGDAALEESKFDDDGAADAPADDGDGDGGAAGDDSADDDLHGLFARGCLYSFSRPPLDASVDIAQAPRRPCRDPTW